MGQPVTYGVVVLSYRRPESVLRCVSAVLSQQPAPETVAVWHNAPSRETISGCVNVLSSENYRCRARHALAMLMDVETCVFVDDDCLLGQGVCDRLLQGVEAHPHSVVGYTGRCCKSISDRMYWEDAIRCADVEAPVSVVKGRLHAVRRELLHHAFSRRLPERVWTEDDIVLNASVQMSTGEPSWVVPCIRGLLTDIRDELGNENRPDHWARRNAACKYMADLGWDALRWKTTRAS